MDTALPRSFTEIAGWREAFREAARRLDEVRTGSLFPEIPATLCGEPVRAFTLRDWTILDQAENPLVAGGKVGVEHCCGLLWLLSPHYRPGRGVIALLRRAWLVGRVLNRYRYDEPAIVSAVIAFVDDAFLDHPGAFAAKSGKGGYSATQWPRKTQEIELCGEVMRMYPSFGYEALRHMPLAQFWQWLHDARSAEINQMRLHARELGPYRNYQLTDKVNADACQKLNEMRAAQTKKK